ncbi:MAG: helix-turn-helix transcriptional regulator [Myxococcota bacterium]
MINLLANLLVIEGIRAWLDGQDDESLRQWFGALRDPQIGRVLMALHNEPGGHWTVERMARLASMSKSSFHQAFKSTVGVTPLKYVLYWKMHFAASRLSTTKDSVAEVATACGYDSESAFSRAFRRELGYAPREARALR